MRRAALYKRIITLVSIVLGITGCSGKTSNDLYVAGVKELQQGNSGSAIVLFKNALEKDQNHVDARYQLARAYMASGKFEQAEKEFQKVQRQNPSLPEIKLELAKLYGFLNKPELAIREGEEYLAAHPGSTDALEALGIAYAGRNMPQDSESYFLRALDKNPSKLTTRLELARLYAAEGKAEKSRELLTGIIKVDPRNQRAYYMLANLEITVGQKDRALDIFKKLEEINGSDPVAPYKAGLIYLEKGDINTAEKIADNLVTKFPKNGEGYRLKGIACYKRQNAPEAIAALQVANKFQPGVAGYYYLGLSLYSHGELESALSQFRLILDKTPSFQQARLLVGMILLRQKRVDDAITEINRLLEADGKNALAHNILGSAYMAKGMYDEGMKEFNRAIQLNPKIVDAHLKKGVFHLSQGKTGEFEADIQAAVKVAPELLNTRLTLASFYARKNNHGKALAVLSEGLTGGKSDAALYTYMAKLMFATRKPDRGIQYLQKAKGCDPGALFPYFSMAAYYASIANDEMVLNECAAVLQKDPANVRAMLCIAELLERKGRDGEALAYYLKAKETKAPAAYLTLANYHVKKKDNRKALSTLDEALKNAPRTIAILEMKGRLLMMDKRYKEALKTYDEIETITPERGLPIKVKAYLEMNKPGEAMKEADRVVTLKLNSAYGYMLLAAIYRHQNKPERAIEELVKGLKVDGKNPEAGLMLAEMYAMAGNSPQAIRACENVIRIHPDFKQAYFTYGMVLDKAGNKKEAVNKYLQALTIAANYLPALNNLACLYADGYGSKEEALRLAQSALTLQPENPRVMDTLGYVFLKNGRLQDARRTLEKAAALLPDNPTIDYHLALAYKASGDKGAAVARLEKALRSGDFTEKMQARTLLSELN